MKDGRSDLNRADHGLEDKVNSLPYKFDKLNGVNCRRLIDKNEGIINSIRDISIEMNKGTVSEDNINIYCNEHKKI